MLYLVPSSYFSFGGVYSSAFSQNCMNSITLQYNTSDDQPKTFFLSLEKHRSDNSPRNIMLDPSIAMIKVTNEGKSYAYRTLYVVVVVVVVVFIIYFGVGG